MCTFPRGLRLPWPADFRRAGPSLQLGLDGRREAIGGKGMLPLQVQANAVEFFLGDVLHDQYAIGLTAFEQACAQGQVRRV